MPTSKAVKAEVVESGSSSLANRGDAAAGPDSTQLAVVERREPGPLNLFGADRPEEVVERATSIAKVLKAVVTKQGLVSNIKGKEYPKVEAWVMLGSMLGVFASTIWTRRTDDGQGWEARVEARTLAGDLVGAGEAQCSRSESTWSGRDDFALRAMAQTRATSRALRQPLGFVMVLAGYEATPEAEMPPSGSAAPAVGSGGDPYGDREWGDPPGTPAKATVPAHATAATAPQKKKLSVLAGELGWDDDRRHAECGKDSFNQLTKHEASELIEAWSARLVAGDPSSEPEGGGKPYGEGGTKPTSGSGTPEHEHIPAPSPVVKTHEVCTVEGCLKVRRKGTDKWA